MRSLPGLLLVAVACGAVFVQMSSSHYRTDGRLGAATPPLQTEIIEGTAPAPWVYRQTVPQLRESLDQAGLQPGHAAFGLDVLFFLIGALGSVWLGRRAGKREAMRSRRRNMEGGITGEALALVVFTLASIASYEYAKPESVAMVAGVTVLVALLVWNRMLLALGVAALSVGVRPMIPVLFGGALCVSVLWVRGRDCGKRLLLFSLLTAGVGVAYLWIARHVWFPEQIPYYETHLVWALNLNLIGNLTEPTRWHGLALWMVCVTVIAAWTWGAAFKNVASETERIQQLTMGFFSAGWLGAVFVLGKLDELRILMPLMPPLVVLVTGLWVPFRSMSVTDQ